MPTNEERREIAAKLRELGEGVLDSREYEHRAICTVVGCWGDGEYSSMELKDRLADLIEPEPICVANITFTAKQQEELFQRVMDELRYKGGEVGGAAFKRTRTMGAKA